MRINKQRRVSLNDFIIDKIFDIPSLPDETPITEVQDAVNLITDEIKEHIETALRDVDLENIIL